MSLFTSVRDAFQSAASVAGDYFIPGSSLVTSSLVSKGSQEQLNSPIGMVARAASSAAGLGIGQGITGIDPSRIGGAMADTASGVWDSVSGGFKGAAKAVGMVTGAGVAASAAQPIREATGAATGSPLQGYRSYLAGGNSAPIDSGAAPPVIVAPQQSASPAWLIPALAVGAALVLKG